MSKIINLEQYKSKKKDKKNYTALNLSINKNLSKVEILFSQEVGAIRLNEEQFEKLYKIINKKMGWKCG